MEILRLSTVAVLFGGVIFLICNLTGAELIKKEPIKLKVPGAHLKQKVHHKKVVVNERDQQVAPPVGKKLELPQKEQEEVLAAQRANDMTHKRKQREEEQRLAALKANMKPKKEDKKDPVEGAGDGPVDDKKEIVDDVVQEHDEDHHGDNDYSYDTEEEAVVEEVVEEEDSPDDYDEINHPLENNKMVKPLEAPQPPKPKKQIPNLEMLSEKLFVDKVKRDTRFIINVGNLGCEKCQEFYQDFRLVFHYFHDTKQHIDSYLMADHRFIEAYQFDHAEFPLILYYRHGVPVMYDGPLTATSVQTWVEDNRERATVALTDDNFDSNVIVTDDKTTQWIIMLYDPDHKQSWRPLALLETLANRLRGQVNIGLIDVTKNPALYAKLRDSSSLPCMFLMREHDMVELHFGDTKLTLDSIKETYGDATLNFQEKLSKAALQVKGFVMYTGGAVTVIIVIFMFLCSKVARVGERRIKKGV